MIRSGHNRGVLLHTLGREVTLEHYRRNPVTNQWEELEPIEQNPTYDFNYQQASVLPREHLVLPVSHTKY